MKTKENSNIVDALLAYIRDNNLKAGDTLPTAEDLCSILNCSRVTVREGLSYLKGLGVLQSAGRGRNIQIAAIDPVQSFAELLPIFFMVSHDIADIGRLRCEIELGVFPAVISRITDAEIKELEDILDQNEKLLNLDDVLSEQLVNLDFFFHETLCRISGNRLAESISHYFQVIQAINNPNKALRMTPEIRKIMESVFESHRAILFAIRARNVEAGLLLLQEHLSGPLEMYMNILQETKR